MKHDGPLRPERPEKKDRWWGVVLTFATAGIWLSLDLLIEAEIISEAMLLILIAVAALAATLVVIDVPGPIRSRRTQRSTIERGTGATGQAPAPEDNG